MVLHRVTHITQDLRKAQALQILPFSIFTPPWPFFTALPFSRVQMVFWRSNGHLTFDHVFGDQMAPQVCPVAIPAVGASWELLNEYIYDSDTTSTTTMNEFINLYVWRKILKTLVDP